MTALDWDGMSEADTEALVDLTDEELAELYDLYGEPGPEPDPDPLAGYSRPATRGPVHVDPQREVVTAAAVDDWPGGAA
ncbi:hypothetical protein ACIP9H_40320 [Streptomyces sp. NPDC088732]|uniref:hypothetical protein n=1 Tax=Streptomyces sp. NPDC088732 TaxID=3365879 RepID=UPI0037FE0F6A